VGAGAVRRKARLAWRDTFAKLGQEDRLPLTAASLMLICFQNEPSQSGEFWSTWLGRTHPAKVVSNSKDILIAAPRKIEHHEVVLRF